MRERTALRPWLSILAILIGASLGWAGEAAKVEVVSDDGSRIVLDLRLLDWRLDPVEAEGRTMAVVRIPGEAVSLESGAPDLPHVSRDVIVPDDAEMALTVLSDSYRDLPALVAPSKGSLPRTQDPGAVPYRFGPEYRKNAFHPSAVAALGDPYVLRDHRGVTVRWNPIQYDPVTATLRVHDRVLLEVRAAGRSASNVLRRGAVAARPSRAFDSIYRAHFVNYAPKGRFAYPPVDEAGEMLVIAYDDWIPDLAPFVSHKTAMGMTTTVVGVSTIGNSASAIKGYIQSYYDSHDLAFVLLVGDSAQVATPIVNASDASDPSYSKLAGADNYPDILVGRFSAQTAEQVDTQVERSVQYEDLPAQRQAWYRRGIGIASSQGAGAGDEGQSDRQHEEEIRGWLLGDEYTLVDQIYDPGATDAQVAAAVNAGRGIINYTGHGSATSWGTTAFDVNDVAALVNADQLPFIVSVACNNGEFNHYDPCFAEAWLRATKDGRPTGAVAVYMSSISQSWASPMEAQDEFNLRFTDPTRPYESFGALCFAGSSSMMSAYGTDGVNMFNTWHVFGDPSILVAPMQVSGLAVEPKDGLTAEGPVGGVVSPSTKTYTLENLSSTPLDYEVAGGESWATLTGSRGALAPGGAATVTVTLNDATRNLDLGEFTDTLRFTNLTDHDGDTSRALSVRIRGELGRERWTLDADPGWTRQGEWAYGIPTGSGGGGGYNPDPASGATGSWVFGVNLRGDFATNKPGLPYYLTLGPIDLTGVHGATLRFQRWLNTQGPPAITTTLQVSRDGSSWTSVWSAGGDVTDGQWSPQAYDISATADDQPSVYVRWGYQVATRVPGGAGSGWNIDDVEIWGEPLTARIALSVERDRLDWTPLAGVSYYDVASGDLGILAATAGDFTAATEACLADNVSTTTLANSNAPSPGAGRWYAVRGASFAGVLTWQDLTPSQVGGRDDEIDASAAGCP